MERRPVHAMVFVWSYLSDGDANYTLVQVSGKRPYSCGCIYSYCSVAYRGYGCFYSSGSINYSVVVFVLIPLISGFIVNRWLIKKKGNQWFTSTFLPKLKPVSILALLTTLVLLFAFQGEQITNQPFAILLIAIPLIIQTYFIFFTSWYTGKYFLKLPYCINAPAGMIGASNFFELAVAVAISLFGLNSGASLVTVVGVLIEVPIMLSLVRFANKNSYTNN